MERVELYDAQQYGAEFLRINPNHNVPVLEIIWDNDETQYMLESAAMVTFIADAHPEKNLAPIALRERPDYLQMLHFGATTMDMILWQIRVHEHLLPAAERDARTIERYRKKFVEEIEPQLSQRLHKTEFVCGDSFTAADCVVAHSVMWARAYGLCHDDAFKRYLSSVSKRPAFMAAFADAREFTPIPPADKPITMRFTG